MQKFDYHAIIDAISRTFTLSWITKISFVGDASVEDLVGGGGGIANAPTTTIFPLSSTRKCPLTSRIVEQLASMMSTTK